MKFHEFAQGLYPFCSGGAAQPVYFTELIGNFIQDAAMDACKVLKAKPDTRYRYVKTDRRFPVADAQYIYDHRDMAKFTKWIDAQMYESDSYDAVSTWLNSAGIICKETEISEKCANLLETIILEIIGAATTSTAISREFEQDFALVAEINKKIESLHRPTIVSVPKEATPEEKKYIDALYCAYGDAENKSDFCEADLALYPDYDLDLEDRRIDFYAAETINRGVLEFKNSTLSSQFDVLKSETHDAIKDTVKRTYPNGFDRMLAVMEQVVKVDFQEYLLSKSPYWIGGKIKKGVCHHLVNDGKLQWVKKK